MLGSLCLPGDHATIRWFNLCNVDPSQDAHWANHTHQQTPSSNIRRAICVPTSQVQQALYPDFAIKSISATWLRPTLNLERSTLQNNLALGILSPHNLYLEFRVSKFSHPNLSFTGLASS